MPAIRMIEFIAYQPVDKCNGIIKILRSVNNSQPAGDRRLYSWAAQYGGSGRLYGEGRSTVTISDPAAYGIVYV